MVVHYLLNHLPVMSPFSFCQRSVQSTHLAKNNFNQLQRLIQTKLKGKKRQSTWLNTDANEARYVVVLDYGVAGKNL